MTSISIVQSECPICSGETVIQGHGVVAPFISELSNIPLGQPTEYRWCESCDFSFFSTRYGSDDMSAIYGAYRSPEYLRVRHSWEPWYTKRLNNATSSDSATIAERRAFMDGALNAILPGAIECAVDFGGDEGQFFPDIDINERIVIDLSNGPLHDGVTRISSLSDLGDQRVDLVIVAHVLEHLVDPLATLNEIHEHMTVGGVLYVEVPLDRFDTPKTKGKVDTLGLSNGSRIRRWAFIARDFLTTASRQYRSKIPPFGVIKQSEHINYFSKRSIQRLLAASGFEDVRDMIEPNHRVGGARMGRYGVAARWLPKGYQTTE